MSESERDAGPVVEGATGAEGGCWEVVSKRGAGTVDFSSQLENMNRKTMATRQRALGTRLTLNAGSDLAVPSNSVIFISRFTLSCYGRSLDEDAKSDAVDLTTMKMPNDFAANPQERHGQNT
jgi:hypothetical protein